MCSEEAVMLNSLDHVGLSRSPLKRVICQMRYPRELGVGPALVRLVQKKLTLSFPQVREDKIVTGLTVARDAQPIQLDLKDVFQFLSEDGKTAVQLTDEFVTVETSNYLRFDDFATQWAEVISAVVEVLELNLQTRFGLRYTNVVGAPDLSEAGNRASVIQGNLIRPIESLAEVVPSTLDRFEHTVVLNAHPGVTSVRYAFPSLSAEPWPFDRGFVIDVDSYDEGKKPIQLDAQQELLTSWNRRSYELLKFSVTGDTWESFGPEE
jgi:uncharacterized protein (TIGR04255 family)